MPVKFKSATARKADAQNFLMEYRGFVDQTAAQVLKHPDGPPRNFEIDGLIARMDQIKAEAETMIADKPFFNSLDADLKDDIKTIAEEVTLAKSALEAENDPDQAWASMPPHEKRHALRDKRMSHQSASKAHAILTFDDKVQRSKVPIPVDPTRPKGAVIDDGMGGPRIIPPEEN
jgi:hypothetical protein